MLNSICQNLLEDFKCLLIEKSKKQKAFTKLFRLIFIRDNTKKPSLF
jgi:hypothetical protein